MMYIAHQSHKGNEAILSTEEKKKEKEADVKLNLSLQDPKGFIDLSICRSFATQVHYKQLNEENTSKKKGEVQIQ